MTIQATEYNAGGTRQTAKHLTITIPYTDWSDITSAGSSVLDIAVLPPGAIVIDVQPHVGTVFNGGTSNALKVGYNGDHDAFYTSTSLGSAGAMSKAPGADIGKVQTAKTIVQAKYTVGAAVPSAGSVQVTIAYIEDGAADSVFSA